MDEKEIKMITIDSDGNVVEAKPNKSEQIMTLIFLMIILLSPIYFFEKLELAARFPYSINVENIVRKDKKNGTVNLNAKDLAESKFVEDKYLSLSINFTYSEDGTINYVLKNKTASNIKIIWNESKFYDTYNNEYKLFLNEKQYSNPEIYLNSEIIKAGGSKSGIFSYIDVIDPEGERINTNLFNYYKNHDIKKIIEKPFKVSLMVETKDGIAAYEITFKLKEEPYNIFDGTKRFIKVLKEVRTDEY